MPNIHLKSYVDAIEKRVDDPSVKAAALILLHAIAQLPGEVSIQPLAGGGALKNFLKAHLE